MYREKTRNQDVDGFFRTLTWKGFLDRIAELRSDTYIEFPKASWPYKATTARIASLVRGALKKRSMTEDHPVPITVRVLGDRILVGLAERIEVAPLPGSRRARPR